MTYYAAAPERISTEAIDGGIEITAEQYSAALGVLTDPDDKRTISTDGGVFALVDPPEPEPEPEPEPQEPGHLPLTPRQLRLGLIGAGISLASVDAAINSIENQYERDVARVEWEYASIFERTHPMIGQIGTVLGLTTEQIDAMWDAATTL